MGASFRASYEGIGELLKSPMMEAEMRRRAEKVRAAAEARAPVGDPASDPHPGRYKASFRVVSGRAGGVKGDRAFGRTLNDSPEAFYVEWGTSRQPAHHTLLNAVQAARA